jgi:peroxiredoxin
MANLGIGDQAIAFELLGIDNQPHALADYADSAAVVVIFSCNHCPYVRAWEDRLVAIQNDYAARGVQLVAINANDAQRYPDDSFSKMQQRAQEKAFPFPYLFDETQEIARAYGAERTPEVFLFDQDHRLRYHGAIDDNFDNPREVQQHYLRNALDAVLSGQEPPAAQTPLVGCTVKWKP